MSIITRAGLALALTLGLGACASEASDDDTAGGDTTETTAAAPGETTAPAGPSVNGEPDEVDDVTVTGTRVDALNFMVADLSFTNDSSKASSYLVELDFLDGAGNKITSGFSSAENVQPGATGTAEGLSGAEAPADGKFTVRLVSVDRLAS